MPGAGAATAWFGTTAAAAAAAPDARIVALPLSRGAGIDANYGPIDEARRPDPTLGD